MQLISIYREKKIVILRRNYRWECLWASKLFSSYKFLPLQSINFKNKADFWVPFNISIFSYCLFFFWYNLADGKRTICSSAQVIENNSCYRKIYIYCMYIHVHLHMYVCVWTVWLHTLASNVSRNLPMETGVHVKTGTVVLTQIFFLCKYFHDR